MTLDEARVKIEREFIDGYYEFLEDVNTWDPEDPNGFGKKYGFVGNERFKELHGKDTQKNLLWYQGHVFTGRYLPAWEKIGYDRRFIYDLHRSGFLSYQYYSNWMARATGQTDFYYINQAIAKTIYKKYKK